MSKTREYIPAELRRKLLVGSGHKCSVPFCGESNTLEIHHINSKPDDNRESNLIVLCPNHHARADRNNIDRKSCAEYKKRLEYFYNLNNTEPYVKEKNEIEGIDVGADSLITSSILYLGRKYMNWRYGKPDASLKKELAVLGVLSFFSFVPILYGPVFGYEGTVVFPQNLKSWSAILGFFLVLILTISLTRRCTKCGGYFGIELINKKLIDEKEITRTEDTVQMRKTFHNDYLCAICGNESSKTTQEDESIEL